MNDFNSRIISEFRSSGGIVDGPFSRMPLLLLHHTGARTGTQRVSPLAYRKVNGGWAVFASKAGADTNPGWFHNLLANPMASIEIGTETVDVRARVAEGEEHDTIWEAQKTEFSNFADYERKTRRDRIPVVILEPA